MKNEPNTLKALAQNERLIALAKGCGQPLNTLCIIIDDIRMADIVTRSELSRLVGYGIPVISNLSVIFKCSVKEVFENMDQGIIFYRDIQRVIEKLTNPGGEFYNLHNV